jgi:hypothetical protein
LRDPGIFLAENLKTLFMKKEVIAITASAIALLTVGAYMQPGKVRDTLVLIICSTIMIAWASAFLKAK